MIPIETKYKGYRFRSRLEARWAVFFSALGLAWEYEPEGFELDNGQWYLPDFRVHYPEFPGTSIPDTRAIWFEIKSSNGLISEDELTKLESFSMGAVLIGPPEVAEYPRMRDIRKYLKNAHAEIILKDLCNCAHCFHVADHYLTCSKLASACAAAKSARFERGETPSC